MLIIPALLELNINDLSNQIKRLSPYFNRFQIDIADGLYAPNKTIQTKEILELLTNNQSLITNNLHFDFHLMVKDYETELRLLQKYQNKIKIGYVLIHSSLSPDYSKLSTNYSLPIGLVVNLEEKISNLALNYSLSAIKAIQIMSIPIGFQGSAFVPKALNKIEQLRNAGYRNKILLDGGVNSQTIKLIYNCKYLPDIICPGSFIVRSTNIRSAINQLIRTL